MQFRNKRVMEGSSADFHRAEPSQQLTTTPPLDMQRAKSSCQHVRALNTQFARSTFLNICLLFCSAIWQLHSPCNMWVSPYCSWYRVMCLLLWTAVNFCNFTLHNFSTSSWFNLLYIIYSFYNTSTFYWFLELLVIFLVNICLYTYQKNIFLHVFVFNCMYPAELILIFPTNMPVFAY